MTGTTRADTVLAASLHDESAYKNFFVPASNRCDMDDDAKGEYGRDNQCAVLARAHVDFGDKFRNDSTKLSAKLQDNNPLLLESGLPNVTVRIS